MSARTLLTVGLLTSANLLNYIISTRLITGFKYRQRLEFTHFVSIQLRVSIIHVLLYLSTLPPSSNDQNFYLSFALIIDIRYNDDTVFIHLSFIGYFKQDGDIRLTVGGCIMYLQTHL